MRTSATKVNVREQLEYKIKLLNGAVWEYRANNERVKEWVHQFASADDIEHDEQIQALYLLSHFLYFGQIELRSLLKSLYRDLVRSPEIHDIRRRNNDTFDKYIVETEYQHRLSKMRFFLLEILPRVVHTCFTILDRRIDCPRVYS